LFHIFHFQERERENVDVWMWVHMHGTMQGTTIHNSHYILNLSCLY
jgi:hypothetical protein